MICPLHAWGDESVRSHGFGAPAYLLAASVVDTDDVAETRAALAALRPTRGKLHWHDLADADRLRVVDAVGGLRARHLVVVASPTDLRREERARAVCIERLGWELARRDVRQLTLEARSRRLMERDLRVVEGLRGRRIIPTSLRVAHGAPDVEPMLWLPDQVLGAFGAARAGGRAIDGQLDEAIEEFWTVP